MADLASPLKQKKRISKFKFNLPEDKEDDTADSFKPNQTLFTPYHLMLMLDSRTLEALEEQWKKEPEGLTLDQFVWLMQCTLPHPPEMKRPLYDGLIQLFNDIDINGDQRLEWDEFTRYITDAVISQKKMELLEDQPASDGMYAGSGNVEDFNVEDHIKIEKAYSKSAKAYTMDSSSIRPLFNDKVVKAKGIMSDLKYIVLVSQCDHLKIIDVQHFTIIQSIDLPKNHRFKTTMLLDFDTSETTKSLAALSSEKKFFFWSYSNVEVPLLIGEMDILMVNIRCIPSLDIWVTNSNGPYIIKLWKFDGQRLIEKTTNIQHDKKLTSIFYVSDCDSDR